MDNGQILSWIIGAVGITGFLLAGRKIWWAWYINLACQVLWIWYALASNTPAFFITAMFYSFVFSINAWNWTKDHRVVKKIWKSDPGTTVKFGKGTTITRLPDVPTEESKLNKHGFTESDIHLIARTCHETNRILQMANDEEASLPWHLAPEWQKDSAIEGVQKALDGETAEELHASWVRHKLENGWIWGPFKDENMKTHPCMVAYSELPEEQRIKDEMFRAVVKSFKLDKQYADVPKS